MRTAQIAALTILFGLTIRATADDFPQWRGPTRDGISKEKGLLAEWPAGGPKLRWKRNDIGNGYSTPSVAGGRLYLMVNRGDDEFAVALSEKDGSTVWTRRVGQVGKNEMPRYPGARSTPTIDGDRAYVLGSDGDLACLNAADGAVIWKKSLRTDLDGKPGMWAYAESVLIDGDALVCTPGGEKATMAALDKKDGRVLWRCAVPGGDRASYSSIQVAELGGVRQYVQWVHNGVIGVEAKTGKFLWKYEKSKDEAANIAMPLLHASAVLSSSGRNGTALTRIEPKGDGVEANEVYFTRALAATIGGMVRLGEQVYGSHRDAIVCLDWATGKVRWRERSVGPAAILYADGRLYVRGEDKGEVVLLEATPEAYREKGRFTQPERSKSRAWPYPVVANGRLYLRDENLLFCYDVQAK